MDINNIHGMHLNV